MVSYIFLFLYLFLAVSVYSSKISKWFFPQEKFGEKKTETYKRSVK
jgi:hypothetical protein